MITLFKEIFKANDIRGIVGKTLFDETAFDIGRALAAEMSADDDSRRQKIAVAYDTRLSGKSLAGALIKGLTRGGLSVMNIGMAPTPALYYAATTLANGNGIMVTGSHNPKEHNGMKIMLGCTTLKGEGIANLYRRIETADFPPTDNVLFGSVQHYSVAADYIAAVAAANPCKRKLKIVTDAGNGAVCDIAPALFEAMGHEVVPLFCEPDGTFPNHHPDPAQLKNLSYAKHALARNEADLALVFDGDGDRLGALLPGQPPIFPDRLLMVFARDILSRQPKTRVVFDVKCSAHLAKWVKQHGGIADMQPTGHAFIKAQMQKTGAQLGGEMSGHFYFKEKWFGFDDALFAGARLAAILSSDEKMMASIPDALTTPELHIDMSDGDQHQFMEQLKSKAKFSTAKKLITIDGVRAEYKNGFGLVRASNTTAALVLRFEADDEDAMAAIQKIFRKSLANAGLNPKKIPF